MDEYRDDDDDDNGDEDEISFFLLPSVVVLFRKKIRLLSKFVILCNVCRYLNLRNSISFSK